MALIPGRYFSSRDILLVNSFNAELLGDIVQTTCILYKVAPNETKSNIYGESDQLTGKTFFPGIETTCWIARDDTEADVSDFGPDRNQNVQFRFREETLKLINFYPEIGDVVEFNKRYYLCDNIVQENFMAGQPDKSLAIIMHTHYTRLSQISVMERQY
jgi:hypothetical protein